MSTVSLAITTGSWTKVADANDTDFMVTWDTPRFVDFASTELDETPSIKGHRVSKEKPITREELGAGYVWARLVPDGSSQLMNLTLSKTKSIAGAIGGFDSTENVHKVAMTVWNPDTLAWERATAVGGSSGGSGESTTTKTKRYDFVSSTLMYVGEAAMGTAEGAATWIVRRITLDVGGNPLDNMAAIGSWTNRNSLTFE